VLVNELCWRAIIPTHVFHYNVLCNFRNDFMLIHFKIVDINNCSYWIYFYIIKLQYYIYIYILLLYICIYILLYIYVMYIYNVCVYMVLELFTHLICLCVKLLCVKLLHYNLNNSMKYFITLTKTFCLQVSKNVKST